MVNIVILSQKTRRKCPECSNYINCVIKHNGMITGKCSICKYVISCKQYFHGLFNIPENSMLGTLNIVKDYDTISHKMQTSIQSSYFNERFGRSDFKEIYE